MCVKLFPRNLNSNPNPYTPQTFIPIEWSPHKWPPHQGCAVVFFSFSFFKIRIIPIIEECLTKIWLILLILICHCPKMWMRPMRVVVGMTLAFKLKQLKLILHSNSTNITRSLQFLDSPHKVLTKNQYSHSLSYLGISHAFFLIWMFSLSL